MSVMIAIPGGLHGGVMVNAFDWGKDLVTNAEYNSHVDSYSSRPFVLLKLGESGTTLQRGPTPESLNVPRPSYEEGVLASGPDGAICLYGDELSAFVSDPLLFRPDYVLLELLKCGDEDDELNRPVLGLSWYHALEFCLGNGFLLPTDRQLDYVSSLTSKPPQERKGRRKKPEQIQEWTQGDPDKGLDYGLQLFGAGHRRLEFTGAWFGIPDYFQWEQFENVGFRVTRPAPLVTPI